MLCRHVDIRVFFCRQHIVPSLIFWMTVFTCVSLPVSLLLQWHMRHTADTCSCMPVGSSPILHFGWIYVSLPMTIILSFGWFVYHLCLIANDNPISWMGLPLMLSCKWQSYLLGGLVCLYLRILFFNRFVGHMSNWQWQSYRLERFVCRLIAMTILFLE
jgi:hypothetical protein